MKTFIVSACMLLCLSAAGASLWAEPVKVSIGEQPPLLSKDGGIVNLVIEAALAREGFEAEFDWLPIGRMLALLESDSLDVYVTPGNTAGQHNPRVDFLGAKGVFFFRKDRGPDKAIAKLEDLAGKKVGTVNRSPLRAMFEKAGIIVDEGPFETMFLKLDVGRVDFVSTADVGGILSIKRLFPAREGEFDYTDFSYTLISTGLYAKPGSENERILAAARRGLESMKKDGSLQKMLRDFFGPVNAGRVKVY